MNFNIYLKKNIGEKVTKTAKSLHRSRNSIISEALEEWLERHSSTKWPSDFFDFEPIQNLPNFKEFRKDLKKLPEDPLK